MENLSSIIHGIHHVTAGVEGAQEDVDFFATIVGQRFVKQTVLMDGDVPIYHLYYGNRKAEIGTVMTSFPYKQAGVYGRRGSGQVKITGYTVPEGSLDFWLNRFETKNIRHGAIEERFGQKRLSFFHPCGLEFELVEDGNDKRDCFETDEISESVAVRGFHSVTMSIREVDEQMRFFTDVLGFRLKGQEGPYYQLELNEGGAARTVIFKHEPDVPQGSWINGAGIVHHVAFAVDTDEELKKIRHHISGIGYTDISDIKDRHYFHSCYVRSPGGILCEFTTSDIGLAIDEAEQDLGSTLMLPPWKLDEKEQIFNYLEPVVNPQIAKVK
ncbi:VOC family protein [Peribacillus glennii]|uniref:Ring-cleaving dioxygenase n=1 Tax=Peribacillus glennii TaxID=2303991 RepID=A0A372LFN3_9BACI|nr:VOC family protein [Peribacillus glennii]RFU65098.1 ring-cleaving dioxygenase [Peribacillus glennii]